MAENSSHAPGSNIGSNDGGVRQRKGMAGGGSAMAGGSFGIDSLPGTRTAGNHGRGRDDGARLGDGERAGGPSIAMGKGQMSATRHSDHGAH